MEKPSKSKTINDWLIFLPATLDYQRVTIMLGSEPSTSTLRILLASLGMSGIIARMGFPGKMVECPSAAIPQAGYCGRGLRVRVVSHCYSDCWTSSTSYCLMIVGWLAVEAESLDLDAWQWIGCGKCTPNSGTFLCHEVAMARGAPMIAGRSVAVSKLCSLDTVSGAVALPVCFL